MIAGSRFASLQREIVFEKRLVLVETGGMKFPRLQILTAAQIIDGKLPQVPFGFTEGFKIAKREEENRQGNLIGYGARRLPRSKIASPRSLIPAIRIENMVRNKSQGLRLKSRGFNMKAAKKSSASMQAQSPFVLNSMR
jgi:hypothetical protein